MLAASGVNLILSGNAINSGSIAGRNTLNITAENIQNLGGQMSGNDVKLAARQDFDNLAGIIKGVDSATVSAGRDLNLTTTTQSSANQAGGNRFTQTGIDRVAGIYVSGPAGVLVASAGNNLNLTAAQIQNAGTGATVLTAGNNLNLNTVGCNDKTTNPIPGGTSTTYPAEGPRESGVAGGKPLDPQKPGDSVLPGSPAEPLPGIGPVFSENANNGIPRAFTSADPIIGALLRRLIKPYRVLFRTSMCP